MQDSKNGLLLFRHGVPLSQDQCPKTTKEKDRMKAVPYAFTMGNLMYAMLCTRPAICFVVRIGSRYQSNPGIEHWMAVKHILKYIWRIRDYMLVYHCDELLPLGYMNSNFWSNRDSRKSTFGFVFTLGGGAVS